MEEVKEMEITEGAVGGIEITDGGADTDNAMEITGSGACTDNVMEGGGGEGEHNDEMHRILTSAISSALLESKKGACGLSFRSRSMFHTRGWLHPGVLILVAAVGVRERVFKSGVHPHGFILRLPGERREGNGGGGGRPHHRYESKHTPAVEPRGAQTYPSGRGWWTPMLREDNVHEFDSMEVWEAERGGSGADKMGSVGWPRGHEYDGTCIIEGLCNVIGSSGGILSLNTAVAGPGSLHCRVGVKMCQRVVEKASGGDIFKSSGSIKWCCQQDAP
ncbi:hypothetical protein B0H16DRAFT_1475759 [Mycena metata]|uniref:Uncharacterized protein n=1 Tax=Mycena metata TaxID=1033252 RepID=A0AAD7MHR4_9AGAR|nr:hypothetical protein B0H16DRAFT_1475759 [Mycena metata]